jgi:exodeoxyribonuclease VII small subunit
MAQAKQAQNYQQMADRLDTLISWFESDLVNLDEAIEKYEEAMRLLKQMEDHLKSAENKVKKIAVKFDNG